jgi:hypothetical protein
VNTYFDLFLRSFLTRGPILGKQLPWLHYGRPVRAIRFGVLKRGFSSSIFAGTDTPSTGGSGTSGYGDPVLVEGPGPLHGTDDDEPTDTIGVGGTEGDGGIGHDGGV